MQVDSTLTLPVIPERGTPVTALQLLAIEATICELLPGLEDVDLLTELHDRARALESYLRDKELQRPMMGVQRRIEARIGQLVKPYEQLTHALTRPSDLTDFRLLARALNGECELTEDEWRKSRRALLKLVRYLLGLMPETPPLPDGIFNCIVADPPWQLTTGPGFMGAFAEGNQPLDYEQMSVEEIRDLGELLQPRIADDAHLYLWTTNHYVEASYAVARAWGFQPSTLLVWAKEPQGIGLGGTFRLTTEFVLFARRGNLPDRQIIPTTWFTWPRGRHSEKPAAFFALVESVTPGVEVTRLEMFAREARPGWTVWGDEVAARG